MFASPASDMPGRGITRIRPLANEPATFRRERVAAADDLDAQAWISAQLPDEPRANLRALAVVARQFDQRLAMAGEKRLQLAVYAALPQAFAPRIGEAQGD